MAGNKQASWEVAQNTRRADDHLHTIAFAVLYLYLHLYPLGWHTLHSHANAETCLTGYPNA